MINQFNLVVGGWEGKKMKSFKGLTAGRSKSGPGGEKTVL